ncbi:MAG: glycosyl transferase family 1 [Ilumatobacteraceae bacterium]|nr:glycosyl transferase family 1 [Ilumatobacteraceae bacterium]
MKVLIASTIVPGIQGGGTIIIDSLERALKARDHEVDVLRFPFYSSEPEMLEQMLALRLHHVADSGDRLICVRTPSYLLRHPAKVLWFIHHHREAYDLWNTKYSNMRDDTTGRALRDLIRNADEVAFSEARSIFTNSAVVRDRLRHFNDRDAEVLYPPLDHPEDFSCDGYGDSIVYVSRLASHKRQGLAVEAMRYTKSGVRLIIAGSPDSPTEAHHLRDLVRNNGLDDRVTLKIGWLAEEDKARLFATCLAAVYCPFDEDSYGYPSLEAHQSSKAVVSCTDAGGVSELVTNGVNGFLVEPTPQAMAARFDELYEDRGLAERMGVAGKARMTELGISWDHVIDRMLQ